MHNIHSCLEAGFHSVHFFVYAMDVYATHYFYIFSVIFMRRIICTLNEYICHTNALVNLPTICVCALKPASEHSIRLPIRLWLHISMVVDMHRPIIPFLPYYWFHFRRIA